MSHELALCANNNGRTYARRLFLVRKYRSDAHNLFLALQALVVNEALEQSRVFGKRHSREDIRQATRELAELALVHYSEWEQLDPVGLAATADTGALPGEAVS